MWGLAARSSRPAKKTHQRPPSDVRLMQEEGGRLVPAVPRALGFFCSRSHLGGCAPVRIAAIVRDRLWEEGVSRGGMDKRSLSERDICTKFITPALRQAGWDEMLQIREEVGFTKDRIIVRGKLVTRGQAKRADYVLYYKPNILRKL
jgi:hypothetical protein